MVVSEPVSPLPDPFSGRGGGTDDGVHMGEAGRKEEGTGQHQCPIIQDWPWVAATKPKTQPWT